MTRAKPSASYDPDCVRCPRLVRFLKQIRGRHPEYWARPVPSFGAADARIVIVGLAPGMHGANRTGRPFTGDYAGILLYKTLHEHGLASAPESSCASDPLALLGVRIVNSVKCVPPENKPLPAEVRCCNAWLSAELRELSQARVYLALGRIAHDAFLMSQELPRAGYPFAHGHEHSLTGARWLLDSYHCSRYNTQTRRLTPQMFQDVVRRACELAGLSHRD